MMKLLRKILAGLFLTFGLSTLLYCVINLADPHATKEDKDGSLAVAMILSVPSTVLGLWLVWGLRHQHQLQHQLQRSHLAQEQLFLHLLQQAEGEITVTGFALSAQIPIDQAKLYLDEKAKQLSANLKVNDDGVIIYRFPPP